jgi:hypothetical protein
VKNKINEYIFIFLALGELQFNTGEQRHLKKELLFKCSESNVSYVVSHVYYHTSTILVVSSSLELLFDWYNKKILLNQRRRTFIISPPSTSCTNSNNRSALNESIFFLVRGKV